MQLDPPTPVSKVMETVKNMHINTCREPTRTWKPKRPVENIKVSTNTDNLSRNSVPLAPKIPHAGKEAPKTDLPAYGRGKATASAQAKGRVDAPGTTYAQAAASAQAQERKEAEERAAMLEHNKKAAERMKAAASVQAKEKMEAEKRPAVSTQAQEKVTAST